MKNLLILQFILFLSFNSTAQSYSYLGTYNSQGLPNYLVTPRDVVSSAFLNRIGASLPEGYPVPSYNPHYITAGTQTNIEIMGVDSADVWLTFVAEGAGYKNTLGFIPTILIIRRLQPHQTARLKLSSPMSLLQEVEVA
jgi:hypothetical protein